MVNFNSEKVMELIQKRGFRKGYVVSSLDTSWNTFLRWMKGETPIPFVKAVELADLLGCDVNEFIIRNEN